VSRPGAVDDDGPGQPKPSVDGGGRRDGQVRACVPRHCLEDTTAAHQKPRWVAGSQAPVLILID